MPSLKEKIHPNTFRFYQMKDDEKVCRVDSIDLLNSKRLDVLVRYLYVKAKLTNSGGNWAKYAYENLISYQTNGFTKGNCEFDPGKSNMDEYFTQFDALISSMVKNGYSSEQSIIPTCKNTIIDGAHRLACALALGIKTLETVEMTGAPQVINLNDMRQYGMDSAVTDEVARVFVTLKQNTRCAVFFPISKSGHEKAIETLAQNVQIDFEQTVILTFDAMVRLQSMLYGHHEWWSAKNAHDFAKIRYQGGPAVKFVFFQESQEIRPIKEAMRAHHDANNHALHTTDTHEETINLANTFFNKNSLFWINNAQNTSTPSFENHFKEYKLLTKDDVEHICVDTGGVMAAHGLRDAKDLDYIEINNTALPETVLDIALHQGEYEKIGLSSEEIITNPKHHFYYEGLKFISLDIVADLKKHRNTDKDLYDLSLIRYLKKKDSFAWPLIWSRIKYKTRYNLFLMRYRAVEMAAKLLRKILSESKFQKVRATYHKLKGEVE